MKESDPTVIYGISGFDAITLEGSGIDKRESTDGGIDGLG